MLRGRGFGKLRHLGSGKPVECPHDSVPGTGALPVRREKSIGQRPVAKAQAAPLVEYAEPQHRPVGEGFWRRRRKR